MFFLENLTKKTERSLIFGLANYVWLFQRITSTCFFSAALVNFWRISKDVEKSQFYGSGSGDHNHKSFWIHLMMLVVYMLGLAATGSLMILTALTGTFLYRLWLWSFVFAFVIGFFNYVLILKVSTYMFMVSEQTKKKKAKLERLPTEELFKRVQQVAAEKVRENKQAQGLMCESNVSGLKPHNSVNSSEGD